MCVIRAYASMCHDERKKMEVKGEKKMKEKTEEDFSCLWQQNKKGRKPRAKNVTGRRTTSFFHIFFFGCFFWAGRGRRNSRARTAESFSQDDASFRTAHFILYNILSSGGFTAACVRPSRTVPPILDDLDRHVCRSSFDKSTTSSTPWRQWGSAAPPSETDSTEQWVWCLIHMWSMLHVISVICLCLG